MGSLQNNALFDNIPQSDPLKFWANDEDIHYDKVSQFLRFDKNDLSKLSGVSKSSVRFDSKIPAVLKTRLMEIATVCNLVAEFFEGDAQKTAIWFNAPNPMLGNVTPRDMLRLGRYKRLYNFIMEARSANGQEAKKDKSKTH